MLQQNPDAGGAGYRGVFTKFYKADSARKDTSTGLGLTIAAELAKRMKADLQAELEGDVFTILLRFTSV